MERFFIRYAMVVGAVLLNALFPMTCHSSTFGVNPVRIEISATRPNAVMQVENLSSEAVTVQAHAVIWSFQGETDRYTDTDDIMLNPPIFSLQPHQKQFLRLGLRHNNASTVERTYRLILEQVPDAPKPGFVGLNTILRISVPIFAAPSNHVAAQVSWHAEKTASGIKVVGVNDGTAHLQIKHLELRTADAANAHVGRVVTDYLLPGQTREWAFENDQMSQANQIAFKAATDAGEVHEALVPHP
jgi:fimbrial chaperone protein